jgi:hypothetical protein
MRALVRNRQQGASLEYFEWLQDATKLVYGKKGRRIAGVSMIDIAGLSIPEMLKAVADVVFRQSYTECDLDRRLTAYEVGRGPVPDKPAPGWSGR